MKEQFDKELRDHIKDTFGVYNDLMEDDGWLKYEQKVKRKKRRAVLIWSLPSGIAAALALVWLLNIGSYNDLENKTKIVARNSAKEIIRKNAESPLFRDNRTEKNSSSDKISLNNEQYFSADNSAIKKTKSSNSNEKGILTATNIPPVTYTEYPDQTTVIAKSKISRPDISPEKFDTEESATSPHQPELIANTPKETQNALNQHEKDFNNTFSELAAQINIDAAKENTEKKSSSNKLKLGLDASTFMNFTKDGIGQDMNLGVGLVSEYKISKKFSINSGININKQSATYTANSGDFRENSKYSAPLSSLAPMATPVVNQYSSNARLVGFDIPFAIKYSSNNKNLNWFLSTGFSSYTLLTETYMNNISVVNYGFDGIQTTNEVTKEEHKDGLFSNLQLARTLNFSVGLQFPIKNFTSLSVEPFVKYPLRSFGREDLTIGSSGVSLKMNLDKNMFK